MQILIVKGIALLIVLYIYLFISFIIKRLNKKKKEKSLKKLGNFLLKRSFLQRYIRGIAKVLEYKLGCSVETSMRAAMNVFVGILLKTGLACLSGYILSSNVFTAVLLGLMVGRSLLMKEMVYIESYQELIRGIEMLVSYYSMDKSKNLVKALSQTIESTHSVFVEQNFEKVKWLLAYSEEEGDYYLEEFTENGINEYMNLTARFIFKTHHYGDIFLDGNSNFVEKMHEVISLLESVSHRFDAYKNELKGWEILLLSPCLFLDLGRYSAVMIHNMLQIPENFVQVFYNSSFSTVIYYGIILFVFIFHSITLTIIYGDYRDMSHASDKVVYHRLMAFAFVRRFISKKIPLADSADWIALKKLMIESGRVRNLREVYLYKYISLICVIVVAIVLIPSGRISAVNDILVDPMYNLTFSDAGTDIEILTRWITDDEVEMFKRYDIKAITYGGWGKAHEAKILEYVNKEYPDAYISKALIAKRIINKRAALKRQVWFGALDLVFFVIVTFLSYFIPEFIMLIQASLNANGKAEEEVMLFVNVLFLLKQQPGLMIKEVLRWFRQFSFVFHEPLSNALENMDKSCCFQEEIVEGLKEEISVEQFETIAIGLKQVVQGGTFNEVFSMLSQSKQFFRQKHEKALNRMTNDRIIAIKDVSNSILNFAIYVYVMFPLGVEMILMFKGKDVFIQSI